MYTKNEERSKIRAEVRNLSEKEPPPKANSHPAVFDLLMKDIKDRDEFGKEKYGTRLQPFNGRDAAVDAYQEVLDLAVYFRTLIEERKWEQKQLLNIVEIAENAQTDAADQIATIALAILDRTGE